MGYETPHLYSFRRCPYAMRARMALKYSGAKIELREILLKDKPASMLTLSAKGTVPVLCLENGTVIDESRDVMSWSLGQSDPDGWLSSFSAVEQQEIQDLISLNDGEFKHWLDRYKYSVGYPEHSEIYYRGKAELFLQRLENCLGKNPYLFSDRISLADIAIFPFVRQFAFVNKGWFDGSDHSRVQSWLARLLESDLFIKVMNKYQPWREGDSAIYL